MTTLGYTPLDQTNGIIYVIYGDKPEGKYVDELRYSVDSLHRLHTRLPITVVTDIRELVIPGADMMYMDLPHHHRAKVVAMMASPY